VTQLQFADHQGHNLLARHLGASSVRLAGWTGSLRQRIVSKVLRKFALYRGLDPKIAYQIHVARWLTGRPRPRVGLVHLIWGDDLIDRIAHPERCIFTLHQPYELWTETTWAQIARSAGIVAMAERECGEIRRRHPHVPTVFIPHGIDVGFWRPLPTPPLRRVCAVGRYMRNYDMLLRVSRRLLERYPDVTLRWLVNPDFQVPPAIAAALPPARFELARGLSAEELHRFYAESWCFFTPYNNVTASNAIVEAMASGVPVFTTRVGGMTSYGEAAMTLTANNDDDAMLAALSRCLDSAAVRADLATRARRHAEENFSWPHVVAAHEAFYARVLGGSSTDKVV
jgi:glycosyltransferase involved in cell wall biosynthesis